MVFRPVPQPKSTTFNGEVEGSIWDMRDGRRVFISMVSRAWRKFPSVS